MGRKSKKEKNAERAANSCKAVLGDDKLCDKVFDKAMSAGPEKRKKGE
jgi:hypothetical protein